MDCLLDREAYAVTSTFQYDGPSGPGWGVRQWEDLDWYADLIPEFSNPDTTLLEGEFLPVTIRNDGAVSLVGVPVALYANRSLVWADTLNVAESSSVNRYIDPGLAEGTYTLTLTVDENDLKIESDDANNAAAGTLAVGCCILRGDVDHSGVPPVDIADLVYLVDFMFNAGPVPVCFDEGDVDASDVEPIDIADLVYLVDFMFNAGPEPSPCY